MPRTFTVRVPYFGRSFFPGMQCTTFKDRQSIHDYVLTHLKIIRDNENPLLPKPCTQGSFLLSLGRLRRTSRREPWERVCFYPYSQAVPLGVLMVYHGQSSLYSLDHSFFLLLLFLLRHLQVRESLSWTESPQV